MNFKKFISGVSALAIAASAFAAMSVTASAATRTVETDYIGSSTAAETFENGYDASNWTASYTIKKDSNNFVDSALPLTYSGTATDISSVDFKNGYFGLATVTNIEKPASYTTDTDVTNGLPTYVSGNVLTTGLGYTTGSTHYDWTGDGVADNYSGTNGAKFTSVYTFPAAIDSGKLCFSADVYGKFGDKNADGLTISFYNAKGEELVRTGCDSQYIQLYVNKYRQMRSNAIALRSDLKAAAFYINLEVDVDAVTANMKGFDYMTSPKATTVDEVTTYTSQRDWHVGAGKTDNAYSYKYGTGGNSAETSTITDNDYAIAYMKVESTEHTKRIAYSWSLDNVKLYSTKEVEYINGNIAVVDTVEESDTIEGNATALTITFEPGDSVFSKVIVTGNGGESDEKNVPVSTGEGDVLFGIVINKIVTADYFTAVAE